MISALTMTLYSNVTNITVSASNDSEVIPLVMMIDCHFAKLDCYHSEYLASATYC
jgi:hypothetical protein